MVAHFSLIDTCAALAEQCDEASLQELMERTRHADWRVRLSAVVALGDRADAGALPALLEVLRQEDAAPLYTQVSHLAGAPAGATMLAPVNFGPEITAGLTPEIKECWRRRGRLKQAVCWALAAIGAQAAPAVATLCRYAIDKQEDYAVRAAACLALGKIGDASARATLELATRDDEWCTKTEAGKALAALRT